MKKIGLVVVSVIGVFWLVSVIAERAEDARLAKRQEGVAASQGQAAEALEALLRLKANDPDTFWADRCLAASEKGAKVTGETQERCREALVADARIKSKARHYDDAAARYRLAMLLGATGLDEQIADMTVKAKAVAEAIVKDEASKAAKEKALLDEVGVKPTVYVATGSCVECEVYLDRALHDPASFSKVGVSEPSVVTRGKVGKVWRVQMSYRAKNAFGALRNMQADFFIKKGAVVDFVENTK